MTTAGLDFFSSTVPQRLGGEGEAKKNRKIEKYNNLSKYIYFLNYDTFKFEAI